MKKSEISNSELELAWNFIENTDRSIFLTGKAGTGKTTFLHQVKAKSLKRLIVVAPTGVAAINAHGVTIHSFFQLPFGPIIPDGSQFQQRGNYKMRFARQKIDIIKSLDLLIIDEISMVRADLLDGIDQVLRRYKNKDKVFGGVQVLMIGDLQQLAPVVKPSEWNLLESYYDTAYFFSSHCFQQVDAIAIELQHIYRQDNPKFIGILNEIRNNCLTQDSAEELNKRFLPNFANVENDGYITLTTHNNRAQQINNVELHKLANKSYYFKAEIKGVFNEHAFPTHERLELKIGAQVMFIKNDSSPEKRYFNGKIGEIINLDGQQVTVQCPEDDKPIISTPELWESVKYSMDPVNNDITEEFIGSFAQIPLRLAWAITIHKSQGLTFEKAIIDAEASFAHGQTYVALSRCRTLEGMVLKSKISANSIINDTKVDCYIKQVQDHPPTQTDLKSSQKTFQLNLLFDLYDYSAFVYPLKRCLAVFYKNRNSIEGNTLESLTTMLDNGVNELIRVNNSFNKQLQQLAKETQSPEASEIIQARITSANEFFINHTQQYIKTPLNDLRFSTENKEVNKNLNKQIQILEELISYKLKCLKGISDGFNSKQYMQSRAQALLADNKPKKVKKERIDTTDHPELFEELRSLRTSISQLEEKKAFQVFTQQSLYEMCRSFPITTIQLNSINGMGKVRIEKYGSSIIDIISKYVAENDLQPEQVKSKDLKTKTEKGSTQTESYTLFKKGLSIGEIANQRGLVASTIEGHLLGYIESGDIAIEDILSKDKYDKLKLKIGLLKYEGLNDLKSKLEDEFSYSEIRMALIAIEYENNNQHSQ